jgi:hypothetical protein
VIGGAIFTHLTALGIEVDGDGWFLFGLALAVAFGSLVVLDEREHGLCDVARTAFAFDERGIDRLRAFFFGRSGGSITGRAKCN